MGRAIRVSRAVGIVYTTRPATPTPYGYEARPKGFSTVSSPSPQPSGSLRTPRTTTTYTVEGMTCQHCVASVTEELSELDGVTEVVVDLATATVTVDSSERLDPAAIKAAVSEAGYKLVS